MKISITEQNQNQIKTKKKKKKTACDQALDRSNSREVA